MTHKERTETTVSMKSAVMAKNDAAAAKNRERLEQLGLFSVNLMSSPGSGKTTLLEMLTQRLQEEIVVIEGDVQTRRDADRLEKVGCRVYQIETQGACHLDAAAVSGALDALNITANEYKVLVIENVGNLVCPGGYDLGEDLRVGLLSIPEGDDKILKYPSLFSRIDALLITKIDLLPVIEFDVDRAIVECRSLNPSIRVFVLSGKSGEGVDGFVEFLRESATKKRND